MLTGMESELAGIDSYVTKKQGASAAIQAVEAVIGGKVEVTSLQVLH